MSFIRQPITRRERGIDSIFLATYFPEFTLPEQIEEVGVFGGNAASGEVNSGILFSHAPIRITSASGENLIVTYRLRFRLPT